MNKSSMNTLSSNQVTILLNGIMVGVGILSLAGGVNKDAHQDGWISVAIGSLYPLYVILCTLFIHKRFPTENVLTLNKKYFGKILGYAINIMFCGYFIFYIWGLSSGLNNVLRVYLTPFLTPVKILSIVLIVVSYAASQNIQVIGRFNQVFFYSTVVLFFIPLIAIHKANILNLCPVFGSGFLNILKASTQSAYSYGGAEVILLIYPFINDHSKLKSASIKGIAITTLIYIWFTLINIWYLGPDIIPKYLWPFMPVTDSVTIPVINSFRFLFLFLWTIIVYKCITNIYFASIFIFDDLIKKYKFKTKCYALYPIALVGAIMFGDEVKRRNILDYVIPKYTIFNLVWITILVIIIYFKKDVANEKT